MYVIFVVSVCRSQATSKSDEPPAESPYIRCNQPQQVYGCKGTIFLYICQVFNVNLLLYIDFY